MKPLVLFTVCEKALNENNANLVSKSKSRVTTLDEFLCL